MTDKISVIIAEDDPQIAEIQRRFVERIPEAIRIAGSFDEQADNARLGKVEHEIEILVDRDAELVARRDCRVDSQPSLAVDDAAHSGA